MPSSIVPTKESSVIRIDAGATWFRDYRWSIDDVAVDLANYDITVCFFHPTGGVALGPFTVGSGVTKDPNNTGEFEVRIPATETAQFETETRLTMRVDLTRTNSDDPVTEYKVGDVASLITGTIKVYPKHAGK